MNYRVENNQVIFTDSASRSNRKKGRKLGSRLSEIVTVSNLTLSDIARIYSANKIYPTNKEQLFPNCRVTRVCLNQVLANRDNSPAYIRAIESAWRLPIATIREYYQLDKTNPLSFTEKVAFTNDYLQKYFPEKLAEKQNAIRNLFGAAA